MDDTARNSNVKDIWSNDQSQTPPQKPSGGSFGKPGLSGSGESAGIWESDSNEKEETEPGPEVYKAPETLETPEVGETEKPKEVHKHQHKPKVDTQEVEPEIPPQKKIVDRRTGKEVTHRVDINRADSITKTADIKEQEFIEGVEKVHTIV